MKAEAIPVLVGQIWKDNDKRMPERYVLVKAITKDGFGAEFAECEPCDSQGKPVAWNKPTRLACHRMRPTATGWK